MPVEQMNVDAPWPEIGSDRIPFPQLLGHDRRWLKAVSTGLRQRPILLVQRADSGADAGAVQGVLPLVLVQSLLFGKFLVSLPYINTGGIWCVNSQAAEELITRACALADELDVRYLELRHEFPASHPQLNASRVDKVHMRLDLPASEADLEASFKSKLRNQIKKAGEYGLTIRWGQTELLRDFYHVFSVNMRDLGTPVFSKQLFVHILEEFTGAAELCVVARQQRPIAAGLLIHTNGRTEVPSASSLRTFNYTSANMWMYAQMLRRAVNRKSKQFDFGRSSLGSGTYKFKAQWGAQPHPAVWQYYVRQGAAEDMRADAPNKQRLIRWWQKLPVSLTRLVGPAIVRGIP